MSWFKLNVVRWVPTLPFKHYTISVVIRVEWNQIFVHLIFNAEQYALYYLKILHNETYRKFYTFFITFTKDLWKFREYSDVLSYISSRGNILYLCLAFFSIVNTFIHWKNKFWSVLSCWMIVCVLVAIVCESCQTN